MPIPPILSEYTPEGVDLFVERSNLDGLVLAGVGYGVLFTIFVQCVHLIFRTYKPKSTGSKAHWPWLIYTGVMFVLGTVGFAGNTKFVQMTYIDYRNFPGGPNAFTQAFYSHDVNMAGFVSYVFMSWLADGLVLYRFMLFYNFKLWIVALPSALYGGVIAMSIALMVAIKNGGDFWGPKAVNFGISYWSLSIGLNILLTILIGGKLWSMRSKVHSAMGKQHAGPYTSLLSMLIESAALYSIWGMVFIIMYGRNSPAQNLFLPPLGQVQGIAPLLIIFRLGQGKGWNRAALDATQAGGNTTSAIDLPTIHTEDDKRDDSSSSAAAV